MGVQLEAVGLWAWGVLGRGTGCQAEQNESKCLHGHSAKSTGLHCTALHSRGRPAAVQCADTVCEWVSEGASGTPWAPLWDQRSLLNQQRSCRHHWHRIKDFHYHTQHSRSTDINKISPNIFSITNKGHIIFITTIITQILCFSFYDIIWKSNFLKAVVNLIHHTKIDM